MLSVTLDGRFQLELKLHRVATDTEVRDILDQSAALIFANIRKRFLAQTDPDGHQWPVSQAAIDRKISGRDGGTLFDTGRLFHSIQVYNTGPDSRAIGTDVPYGRFHQYGAIHLPKRVFLGFSDDDVKLVEAFLEKKAKDIGE